VQKSPEGISLLAKHALGRLTFGIKNMETCVVHHKFEKTQRQQPCL